MFLRYTYPAVGFGRKNFNFVVLTPVYMDFSGVKRDDSSKGV